MRIAYFAECYHPTHNGVVISMDTFKKALEKLGHKIYIIAPYNRHLQEKDDPDVYRVLSWGLHKDYPIAANFLSFRQWRRINNLKLDLVHLQHPFTISSWGLKLAHKNNIPAIYTYHTLIEEYTHYFPGPSKFKENIAKNLSKNFCNKVNQVVTPSNSMKKILLDYGVKKPIEVIPTGTDIEDFSNPYTRDEINAMWSIPQNKKLLLYVARIAREKNIDFLLDVIVKLKNIRQDFVLLMVGGGPQLEHYKKLVKKLRIDQLVVFTGMQKKPGVNRYFGAGDVFVFPSYSETQGIVITEAMAAGTPPIAINKMGPSDIIESGTDGFLVDLNKNEFAGKIDYLLNNEEIRNKFARASKLKAQKYSVMATAKHMEELYVRTCKHSHDTK